MYHFPFDIAPKASHGTVPSILQSFNPSTLQPFNFLFFPFSPHFRKLISECLSAGQWAGCPQRGVNVTEGLQNAFPAVGNFRKNHKNAKKACFTVVFKVKHAFSCCESIVLGL